MPTCWNFITVVDTDRHMLRSVRCNDPVQRDIYPGRNPAQTAKLRDRRPDREGDTPPVLSSQRSATPSATRLRRGHRRPLGKPVVHPLRGYQVAGGFVAVTRSAPRNGAYHTRQPNERCSTLCIPSWRRWSTRARLRRRLAGGAYGCAVHARRCCESPGCSPPGRTCCPETASPACKPAAVWSLPTCCGRAATRTRSPLAVNPGPSGHRRRAAIRAAASGCC